MSRVITFSRQFPAYHPKAGLNTQFVPKIWNSIQQFFTPSYYSMIALNPGKEKEADVFWETVPMNFYNLGTKRHTIRAGHRWKPGDKFSPRIWSGKPYRSTQVIIAPDIKIKKVWDFKIRQLGEGRGTFWINGVRILELTAITMVHTIAQNDGLSYADFLSWFQYPEPFDGQIIAWSENVNY